MEVLPVNEKKLKLDSVSDGFEESKKPRIEPTEVCFTERSISDLCFTFLFLSLHMTGA